MYQHPSVVHRFAADRQAAFRRQAGLSRLNRSVQRAALDRQRPQPPPRAHRSRG